MEAVDNVAAAILEHVRHAIVAFDAGLKLAAANRYYAEMLDLPAELTRPGTPFDDIIRHNVRSGVYGEIDEDEAVAYWNRRARDGTARTDTSRRPNGTVYRIEKTVLPQGGFVLSYFDITELQRKEDASPRRHASWHRCWSISARG